MSYLLYGFGALILAALGAFLFLRRRSDDDDGEATTSTAKADRAFAAVELKEQPVEAPVEEPEPAVASRR